MKIRLGIVLSLLTYFCSIDCAAAGEKLFFRINPFGRSEYVDEGFTEYQGRTLKVATFRTRIIGFDDQEKIYSDPATGLPVRIERNIKWPFSREYITEDYDQQNFTMVMRKYVRNKLVEEHTVRQSGPIYSAVLFPFSLRGQPEPSPGWRVKTSFPNEYEIIYVGIEEVKVHAGTFEAYHFVSEPHTFDIWISKDKDRIPVRIQGRGTFGGYTMKLHAYYPDGTPTKK